MPIDSYTDYQMLRAVGAHLDRPQADKPKDLAKIGEWLEEQFSIGALSDFYLLAARTLRSAGLGDLVGDEEKLHVHAVKPTDEADVFAVSGEWTPKGRPKVRVELEIEGVRYDSFRGRVGYAVRDEGKVLLPRMARAK